MRSEELYLADIVDTADAIACFMHGIEREGFYRDGLGQSAVLQKLIVIGEAAARLPREFTDQHPDVEWADIIGFRNIAVHDYFSVDWSCCLSHGHPGHSCPARPDRPDSD